MQGWPCATNGATAIQATLAASTRSGFGERLFVFAGAGDAAPDEAQSSALKPIRTVGRNGRQRGVQRVWSVNGCNALADTGDVGAARYKVNRAGLKLNEVREFYARLRPLIKPSS